MGAKSDTCRHFSGVPRQFGCAGAALSGAGSAVFVGSPRCSGFVFFSIWDQEAWLRGYVAACVRACVGGWVGAWVGGCVGGWVGGCVFTVWSSRSMGCLKAPHVQIFAPRSFGPVSGCKMAQPNTPPTSIGNVAFIEPTMDDRPPLPMVLVFLLKAAPWRAPLSP